MKAELRVLRAGAVSLAHCADAGEGRNDIRNENREGHFEYAGAGKVAFEDGVAVIDRNEHSADYDCVTESTFYDRGTGCKVQPFFHGVRKIED